MIEKKGTQQNKKMGDIQQEPPKVGRPKAEIDGEQVRALASIGVSQQDIANVLGVCRETLRLRFKEQFDQGRAAAHISLHQAMYKKAIKKDNTQMQIWLSKFWLKYQEKISLDHSSEDGTMTPQVKIDLKGLTEKQKMMLLSQVIDKI